MASSVPSIKLNCGNSIPQLGFGTYKVSVADVAPAVETAIKVGYRHIDTAARYANEEGVAKGIAAAGVPREQLFITTKVWDSDHGYDETLAALNESLKKLNTTYVDLYLIHWPMPKKNKFVETWKALVQAQKNGTVKSIGVSNFTIEHLDEVIAATHVIPAVNQIELHPFHQQNEMVEYGTAKGIVTQAWSPLAQSVEKLQVPVLIKMAEKYKKSIAQVVLHWHIQKGYVVFPKSLTPSRIEENFNIFDFTLDDEDMKAIANLNQDARIGPHPNTRE